LTLRPEGVCHASYPQDAGAKRPFAPLERFHVKQHFQDFDAFLATNPPRNQLLLALAALLEGGDRSSDGGRE